MKRTMLSFGSVFVAAGVGIGLYAWNNLTYADRDTRTAVRAGFTEHRTTLSSGTSLNYVVGPDNGPPLLLLHAQASAWESYARVLPALSERFRVFAIDFAGHGDSSRTPGKYDVHSIGRDVTEFMDNEISGPMYLSGHSSGGLVAAWVAAARPDLTLGVLFEDPPFFSTEADRMPAQFNYVDLAAPAHDFLSQKAENSDTEQDFAGFYIGNNAWIGYFGGGRDGIIDYARKYRKKRPDDALRLWFLPPGTNEAFAHMHEFDPEFADAFYTTSWQAGFNQVEALAGIRAPSTLVHANWRITDEGILEGAMTDDDAEFAAATLRDSVLERVDTGHGFHFEDPDGFVSLMFDLKSRVEGRGPHLSSV